LRELANGLAGKPMRCEMLDELRLPPSGNDFKKRP